MAVRYLKMTLAYDGSNYAGWQVQPNAHTIQSELEKAWHAVTQETIRITASGRTDAGVHALGQVCSLRTETNLDNSTLLRAINANTADDVCVQRIETAPDDFHAIRDAVKKAYRYVIQYGRHRDPFARNYCWHIPQQIDLNAMIEASKFMLGEHDFASFQAAGSDRASTVREIYQLELDRRSRGLADQLTIEVTANGFLYNMVRNIVGTLVEIGKGKFPPIWAQQVIDAVDRKKAGPTAPSQGLFLYQVWYE